MEQTNEALKVWTTREGVKMSPVEMAASHLVNACRMYAIASVEHAKHNWYFRKPMRGMTLDTISYMYGDYMMDEWDTDSQMKFKEYENYVVWRTNFWIVAMAELQRRKLPILPTHAIIQRFKLPADSRFASIVLNHLDYPYLTSVDWLVKSVTKDDYNRVFRLK